MKPLAVALLVAFALAGCAQPAPNIDPRRGEVDTHGYDWEEARYCLGPDLVTHYSSDSYGTWSYDSRNDPQCKP